MKFETGQEMLDYLLSGRDLYGEKSGCYFFAYNDRGAVCRYYIENDKAKELAKKAREDDSYWGAYLGVGGSIHDIPEETPSYRTNNLEVCELYCKADEWVPAETYGLDVPPTVVNEVLENASSKKIDWIIHICKNGVICADCGKSEDCYIDFLCNAHTHGMEKHNHRDFQLVLALPNEEIGRILNTIGLMVLAGHRFYDGEYINGIYEDCSVRLMEIEETGRKVLRVIIPDKNNIYPENPMCERPYRFQLLTTVALLKADYSGIEAKFASKTRENPCICPYCGAEQGIGVLMDGCDEGNFKCNACAQEYIVRYNLESWSEEDFCYTVIEDVTNLFGRSLQNEAEKEIECKAKMEGE